MSTLALEMLPAHYGDALYLRYGSGAEQYHLWIDGGLSQSFARNWKSRVRRLGQMGAALELLIITHVDVDHLNGVRSFVDANRRGAHPPALVPVREVWFNQYRHIRPYTPEGAVLARELDEVTRWRTAEDFAAAVARRAPRWEKLAERLAHAQTAGGTVDTRGVAEGAQLAGLLENGYPSNTRFGDEAVLRPDVPGALPPEIALPGGARAWVLSPTPQTLEKLCVLWAEYLETQNLAPVWGVSGKGLLRPGEALAPTLAQELMLRDRLAFEPTPKGRLEDLTRPIDALAQQEFEQDTSPANASSIALLFEFDGRKLLLTGDAFPGVVAEGLRRLGYSAAQPVELAAFKLSHHGSRANTSPELLDLVRCERYLISTNGDKFDHPDKECLARVLWANRERGATTLYFNYPNLPAAQALANPGDQARYDYRLVTLASGEALEL